MTKAVRRSLARRSRGDAGFTLIEVIVAMAITLVLMTAMLTVLVSSLQTIAQARQRQTATSLTTQAMERLRALDYGSVTIDNPAAWPMSSGLEYVAGGTPPVFQPSAVLPGVSEPLIVNQYSAKREDAAQTTVDGIPYVVQVYVTDPPPAPGQQQVFNLTVITSWTSSASHGRRVVSQRSALFSPSGCLTAADHPFSGPCQAALVADAGESLGGFTLSADAGSGDIEGFNGRMLSLGLPVMNADLTMEQTASAKGMIATGEGRATSTTDAVTGGVGASVSVTSDPSVASPPTQTTTATQSAGEVSLTGTLGSLVARAPGGTSGTSSAAIYADQSLCKDGSAAATGLVTGPATALRPCSSSAIGAISSDGLLVLRTAAEDAVLVRQASGAGSSQAVAANLAAAQPGVACYGSTPSISSGSCVHSAAYRAVSTTTVFDPAGATNAAPGYVGLWYVTGLTESAYAESGMGARGASYARAGTLNYWNGSGYTAVPLGTALSTTITLPQAVTLTYPDGLSITASGTIVVNRVASSSTGPADCSTTCTAAVDGSSAVRSLVTFTASNGATTSTFGLAADLGGLIASTSFKAAPSA